MASTGEGHPVLRRSSGNRPESLLPHPPGFVAEMFGRKYGMSAVEKDSCCTFVRSLFQPCETSRFKTACICVGSESNQSDLESSREALAPRGRDLRNLQACTASH